MESLIDEWKTVLIGCPRPQGCGQQGHRAFLLFPTPHPRETPTIAALPGPAFYLRYSSTVGVRPLLFAAADRDLGVVGVRFDVFANVEGGWNCRSERQFWGSLLPAICKTHMSRSPRPVLTPRDLPSGGYENYTKSPAAEGNLVRIACASHAHRM